MYEHMHTRFASIALALIFACTPLSANAQTPPAVNVPNHCTASDTGGVAHTYTGQFLGICALVAAKEQGAVNDYELIYDNSFGFYLQSLNGITPSATQYWALYKNSAFSSDGLSSMTLVEGDVLAFQLTDWTDNSAIGAPVAFTVNLAVSTPSVSGPTTGASSLTLHDPFDVPLALAFLERKQRADGSFDSLLLSDWIAISLAGGGAGDAKSKLAQYFIANPPIFENITDFERHAMALQALGINPYNGTSMDYITPIVKGFDGTQVGDISLVNDDVFAIFPLMHAGYSTDDDIIRKTIAFIVSKQLTNGSWENSVDMTAASIQALSLVRQLSGAQPAITSAANYLHTQEKTDGGFGNSFSTSWALQAIAVLSDSQIDWSSGHNTPRYYLATLQQTDGGIEPVSDDINKRLWATAYAIPAIEGKVWGSLLHSFDRPMVRHEPELNATTTAITTIPVTATPSLMFESAPSAQPETPPIERLIPTAIEDSAATAIAPATTTDTVQAVEQPSQTAAAGSVSASFFISLWRSIVSFFTHLF